MLRDWMGYTMAAAAVAAGCGKGTPNTSDDTPPGDSDAAVDTDSDSGTSDEVEICEQTAIAPPEFAMPSAAHPYQACDDAAATGEAPGISNFEDCTIGVAHNEGREGVWFSYNDGTDGTITLDVASETLLVRSSGWTDFGAGVGLYLTHPLSETEHCFPDAGVYAGIRFRARGAGAFRTMVVSFGNLPTAEGGGCDRPGQECYNWPGMAVSLTDEWRTVELPFCKMAPELGWGGEVAPLDPTQITAIQFRLPSGQDIALQLADLAFFTEADAEEAIACCPIDFAPYPENIAPERSDLTLTETLTLHTFDQINEGCTVTRRYLSFVPADLPTESDAPVLIALHGSGGSAETFQSYYAHGRLDELAARDGFIVVYGNGAPGAFSDLPDVLNSAAWRQDIFDDGRVDDVAYLELVLADLEARSVISGNNDVYLTGLSNGGGMVLKAAAERPELWRGIAPFMAFAGLAPPSPPDLTDTGLTRVFFGYSLADPGLFEDYLDLQEGVATSWAAALGLPDDIIQNPVETAVPNTVFEGEDYAGENDNALATRNSAATQLDMSVPGNDRSLRVLVFDHAGHLWPSPEGDTNEGVIERYGFRNQDLDAADAVWEFFSAAEE